MSGAYVSSTTLAPPVAAEQAVRKLPARGKARFQVSYVRYGDQFVKLNGTDERPGPRTCNRRLAVAIWSSFVLASYYSPTDIPDNPSAISPPRGMSGIFMGG
jgi:hypothetical protein